MQQIGRIKGARLHVPQPNLPWSVTWQVDDSQSKSSNFQNLAILYRHIYLDRKVPIFSDNIRIRQAQAFAWSQVEIFQQLFGGKSEARDIFPPGDNQRVLDNRPVKRMTNGFRPVPLFQSRRIANVVIMKVR